MQAISQHRGASFIPLGQRRGIPGLNGFALDLGGVREKFGSAPGPGDYPSPPMSGSPHLPPKGIPESAEASQGNYQQTTHDAYRGVPAVQGNIRLPADPAALNRPYMGEIPEVIQYPFSHQEAAVPRPLSYPQSSQHGRAIHQQHSYMSMPGQAPAPVPAPAPYATSARPVAPDSALQTSPRVQRKTKGHVASACVPCKRAHLRCDASGQSCSDKVPVKGGSWRCGCPGVLSNSFPPVARLVGSRVPSSTSTKKKGSYIQAALADTIGKVFRGAARRPCSRCLNNGKEDICIDVQHKKRGRPRLRDDRESRYDSAGFGAPQDIGAKRPVSLYGSSTPAGTAYDDGLRPSQSQPYRVLKSHPPDSTVPRFMGRGGPTANVNVFPSPLSISTRAPEPAAFLTMDWEIAKASTTFMEALAMPNIRGLKLIDVVAPGERRKVADWQQQMQQAQKMREPTYLPPIFGKEKEDQVIQALGFSQEEISRYPLDRMDQLAFTSQDGHGRVFPVRMGLAKQESIYFVVILLNLAMRSFQPPTPSPNPREIYSYQPMPLPHSQPTPISATFDPRQARMNDPGYGQRQLEVPTHAVAGLSPGAVPTYAASPSRPEYAPGQAYQVPRSELPPTTRQLQVPGYQLPPIRSQQQGSLLPQVDQSPKGRDDRSRVDIGGLIDHSEPSSGRRPRGSGDSWSS